MAERRTREGTSTSEFGVSKRENHDSSSFYDRFPAPTLLDDDTVVLPGHGETTTIGRERVTNPFLMDLGSAPAPRGL